MTLLQAYRETTYLKKDASLRAVTIAHLMSGEISHCPDCGWIVQRGEECAVCTERYNEWADTEADCAAQWHDARFDLQYAEY